MNARPTILQAMVPSMLVLVASVGACSDGDPVRQDPSTATSGSGGAGQGGTQGATAGTASGATAGAAGASAAGSAAAGSAGAVPSAGSGGTGHTCDKPRFGSPMIEVPSPSGVSYCMDVRQVTEGEYAKFVAEKKGDMSGQSERCANNKTYAIDVAKPGDEMTGKCSTYDPVAYPKKVMECQDVCDAEAFCAWAGKRLCGGIGKPLAPADAVKGVAGEWVNACTEGGKHPYPGGDAPTSPSACAQDCQHQQKMAPYASFEYLGYPQHEMIDVCASSGFPGQPDGLVMCTLGGGSASDGNGLPCSSADLDSNYISVLKMGAGIAFRCCAE